MRRPAKVVIALTLLLLLTARAVAAEAKRTSGPLDPRGKIHIPIGIPDTVDTLKTFVEPEGCFSPGVGSYGVYFWVYDQSSRRLVAPTMDGVPCARGLSDQGYPIPWSQWGAGEIGVRTELCEVAVRSPQGEAFVVGVRARVTNPGKTSGKVSLYVALRPLGPAGWPVKDLAVSPQGDALLVEGHPAVVATDKPSAAGVMAGDGVGTMAMEGRVPPEIAAHSDSGRCSGTLRFDLGIAAGESRKVSLVCPVLPGRRAVGHKWDKVNPWFQLDLAVPNPSTGGLLQPDPGLDFYRRSPVDQLFRESEAYWNGLIGPARLRVPDPRWGRAITAMACHTALCLNEGAPDLVVVNLNPFTRDGVYMANFLQKSGHCDLARRFIDYYLAHPFSGRVQPEADNPGQLLWILGEQWLLARDTDWLRRVYASVEKLAALITYYRTTPGPHWVGDDTLEFGSRLPSAKRKELRPGACDGHHPEYTEAFDIAGLRAAAVLARAMADADEPDRWSRRVESLRWRNLADTLFEKYDRRFGDDPGKEYGSYAVLWPCRLYPLGHGKAHQWFESVGAKKSTGWRYFPLATAHQGLLAGSRVAGYGTIASHLDEEQMRGWFTFDEGGPTGIGGWGQLLTTWPLHRPTQGQPSTVAMPDGWVLAELGLLMRDALLFEDGDRLVLLGGVPPEWFTGTEEIAVDHLPTHFGPCAFRYRSSGRRATLTLSGTAAPPAGFVLRLPADPTASVQAGGKPLERSSGGDACFPASVKELDITWAER
jgi:hypothetical protein